MHPRLNRLFGSIALAGCGAALASSSALAATPDDAAAVFASSLIATVGPDVLAHMTGNAGINIASGSGNRQGNALVVSQAVTPGQGNGGTAGSTSRTLLAVSTVESGGGASGAGTAPLRVAVASLGAGALAGSAGNIGINIAAGYRNIQQNTLISR